MRDIRQDLQERIALEEARKEPHVRALAVIDANIGTLRQSLRLEEIRHRSGMSENRPLFENVGESSQLKPEIPPPAAKLPLIEHLLEILTSGALRMGALRDQAIKSGYFEAFPGVMPGRMVHGALLNSFRRGELTRTSDDSYALTAKGRERVSTARKRAMERTTELEA